MATWQDAIMGDNQIALILDVAVNEKKSMLASRGDIAKAQAEISFKVGYEQKCKEVGEE